MFNLLFFYLHIDSIGYHCLEEGKGNLIEFPFQVTYSHDF